MEPIEVKVRIHHEGIKLLPIDIIKVEHVIEVSKESVH